MNFIAKRFNKKMSKLFIRLAWTCVIAFFIFVIGIATGIIDRSIFINNRVLVGVMFIFPFLFGCIFAILSLSFGQNRSIYLARIKEYRQLKAFRDIMDKIYFKDFEAAVNIYNNRLKKGYRKDFMFGYLLGTTLSSTNPERVEKASTRLKAIYDSANPANIDMNK
jgi:ABC-type multidrug transport system permease subunit